MTRNRLRPLVFAFVVVTTCLSSRATESIGAVQAAPGQAPVQERLNRIGNALMSGRGNPQEAVKELKAILAIDPRSAQAHMLLGVAYRLTGSAEFIGEAKAELRQALDLEPGFIPARFYLARLYLDLARVERAREELETGLKQQPGHPQFLALLGETERLLKNPRRSVELNRQALKADESFAESRYYLGLALLDLGERDEGIRELERVVESGAKQADVFVNLGAAYLDAGRFDEALTALNAGTKLDRSRPDLRIQLSRAYRSKGLLPRAQEQLDMVSPAGIEALASGVQQQQAEFDLLVERGLLAIARRRSAAAVSALKNALSMDPNHGPANRGLAEAYLLQGSYKLAAEHATRAEKHGSPLPEDKRKLLQDATRRKDAGKQE